MGNAELKLLDMTTDLFTCRHPQQLEEWALLN